MALHKIHFMQIIIYCDIPNVHSNDMMMKIVISYGLCSCDIPHVHANDVIVKCQMFYTL